MPDKELLDITDLVKGDIFFDPYCQPQMIHKFHGFDDTVDDTEIRCITSYIGWINKDGTISIRDTSELDNTYNNCSRVVKLRVCI